MPVLKIKTKEGFTDKQVWDYLLSKDVNITPLGDGFTRANVPKRLFKQLTTMAHFTEENPQSNEQHVLKTSKVYPG